MVASVQYRSRHISPTIGIRANVRRADLIINFIENPAFTQRYFSSIPPAFQQYFFYQSSFHFTNICYQSRWIFYKINIIYCAELSATNCRAEMSAPNCPAPNCRGPLGNAVHSLLSAEEYVSHYFLMLPSSFNTNYDGITVVKQIANHAIILGKILSYAPRAGFPTS